MDTKLPRSILAMTLILCAFGLANAQPTPYVNNGSKKYRVTAYKISNGTLTSLSNVAEAIPKPTMYIPSAFTPNGDGVNDFFGVKAEGLKEFKMEIYNRWGEVVFVSDDIKKLWDGTYEGKAITSTDVYVYQVKAIGNNNDPLPEEKGTVTLIADGTRE
ncbi:MAG: gliding motility-associated C-terminal domain-containing protein [Bacteroidia bacterium]